MQIIRAIFAFIKLAWSKSQFFKFFGYTFFLLTVLNSGKLLGTIRLDDVMSQDEQKMMGVSQLTDQQKEQLEMWINNKFILKTSQNNVPPLTLQQNLQNGSQLELSDGSIYEIAPTDRSKTNFWLTPISLTVKPSGDPAYPVLLTNTLTGVSVKAKQVQAPTRRLTTP